MRVAYYSAHPDLPLSGDAGYSTHMRGMIGGLEANDAEVVPLIAGSAAPPDPVTSARAVALPGNKITGIKDRLRGMLPEPAWNSLRDLRLIRADYANGAVLEKELETASFDLVYERHTHLHRKGPIVASRHNVPHVLEINSPPDERSDMGGVSPLDRLGRRFAADAVHSTDLAVFVSSALRDAYEELLGEELSNAVVIPNAVATGSIGQTVPRARKPDESAAITVGFVGSLLRWHGIDLLIDAFAEVHDARPDTVLEIVGDGELRPTYEAQARDKNLNDAIVFTGALPHHEALERVASWDVGVMVRSNWYGSPVKLFEYAAMGCSIIAPNVAPAHEVLTEDVEALFVSPNTAEIENALLRLIDDPSLRATLASAAHTRVAEQYTWEKAAATVLDRVVERRQIGG